MTSIGNRKLGRPPDLAKREAILSAATRAFLDQGYSAAAIERIAAVAGVSKLTIYNIYGGKPSLFAAAIKRECGHIRSSLSIEGGVAETLRDQLLLVGHALVEFWSRPQMIQFERRIAAETLYHPEIGMTFLNAGPRHMLAMLADFFSEAVHSHNLNLSDTKLAAEQFASLCMGFAEMEQRFGVSTSKDCERQRVEGAVDFFLRSQDLQ